MWDRGTASSRWWRGTYPRWKFPKFDSQTAAGEDCHEAAPRHSRWSKRLPEMAPVWTWFLSRRPTRRLIDSRGPSAYSGYTARSSLRLSEASLPDCRNAIWNPSPDPHMGVARVDKTPELNSTAARRHDTTRRTEAGILWRHGECDYRNSVLDKIAVLVIFCCSINYLFLTIRLQRKCLISRKSSIIQIKLYMYRHTNSDLLP